MSQCPGRLLLVACLALSPCQPACGESPAANEPARVDRYGDRLPPGALARLGCTRFRIDSQGFGLRYAPDGKTLLVYGSGQQGGCEKYLYQFETGTGKQLSRLGVSVDDFDTPLLHIQAGKPARTVPPAGWCISADGRFVGEVGPTSSFNAGAIRVREIATGKAVFELVDERSHFTYLQFTPDGTHLAAVETRLREKGPIEPGLPVIIRVWDVASRREVRRLLPPEPAKGQQRFRPLLFTFSPDGRLLAAVGTEAGQGGVIRLWAVGGKDRAWRLAGQTESAGPVAFSPDGKRPATVAAGKLRLWDAATGKQVKELADHPTGCAALIFSPDGKKLASSAGTALRL
jgi:WD40 repeat protein